MKKLIILLSLMMSMTGCASFTATAITAAEEQVRLKWAEEWKPALQEELKDTIRDSKDDILNQVVSQLEGQEEKLRARLEAVNVRIEDFDTNQDGAVRGTEAIALLQELKEAKDKDGKPLSWMEILMAVMLGYGTTTSAKEFLRSRMSAPSNRNGAGTA